MDSPAKMLWKRKSSVQVLEQQLTKAQNNLATVVQAAQEQEDWVKTLSEQQSVHPDTLQQNLDKLDRLCNLAQRYWLCCKKKSDELAQLRQDCCYLEGFLESTSQLDISLDRSFEVSQLDLSVA